MASADGSVVIDVEIPVNKVRTDSQEIEAILNALGGHAGDKLDTHFKENVDKVKSNADSASRDIDSKLSKDVKTKYSFDDAEAKEKVSSIHARIKEIPKEQRTDISVEDKSSSVLSRIKNRLMGVNQEGKQTQHTFKSIFLGSALGNLGSNLISNSISGIKRIVNEGMQLNAVTGSIRAQFKAMGLSDKYVDTLVKQIGFLKTRINATGVDISTVQKNMMNWSVIGRKGAYNMTTALGAMAAAGRLNGDQLRMMSMQMMRVGSSGKVSLGTLSRIAKAVPNFYSQLAKGAGVSEDKLKSMLATGKVTQKQFQTWIANSSKYADSAFKDYGKTQAGALAQMKGAWQSLESQMTQPLFNMKTSAMQQLATLMTSKPVQDGAKLLGEGLQRVAFYGMQVLDYLGKHKSDITGVMSDTVKIAGTLAKDVWNDFVGIVLDIGKSIGIINDKGKKSGDALHQLKLALDDIAKNKRLIQDVAKAIIAIAAVKGLGKVAGTLSTIANLKVGNGSVLDLLTGGLNGTKLKGAFQSIKSAGSIKSMSTAGKLTLGASVIFSGAQIWGDFSRAVKDTSIHKKWEDSGSVIGGILGTGIGAWFGGPQGALLGEEIGKRLGKSAGGAFSEAFNPQTVYNLNKPQQKGRRKIVATTENGYYYTVGKSKKRYFQDDRNYSERQLNTGHRLDLTSFLHPQNPVDFVGGILSGGWQVGSHAFDLDYFKRSRAQTNASLKGSWLDNFLFGKMGKPRFTDKGDIGKGVRTSIGKWWNGQTKSLSKQFKPLTSAKVDWGWLDPQKNGLNKWLAGFSPQVHGKAPSLKNLKLERSSILPDIHPIKWIENKFKGFKWPTLPKFKFPEIHPIKWLQSKFKGWHLPKLKLKKPNAKGFNSFIKNLKSDTYKGFNYVKKRAGQGIKGVLGHIDKLRKNGKSNLNKFTSWLGKNWDKTKKKTVSIWDKIKDSVVDNSKKSQKHGTDNFSKLQKGMSDIGKDIHKQWHSLWNGLADFFENIWKNIKKTASSGINGIVGVINGGISGIDNVIHSFGGKEHAIGLIPKVKLATGTLGNFTPSITKPTLALLNDGQDSPETGNRETVWDTKTGALGVVNGTNVPFLLQPGMEVFSASQSRDLGFTRFAKGTNPLAGIESFFSGIGSWIGQKTSQLKKWFDMATKIVAHPLNALDNLMKPSSKGLNGIFVQLGKGMFDQSKDAAKNWWSTLWSMASSRLNGDGGPATGLLKAVEKYGEGHRYVWGAAGPTEFDCSGLVMYALKKAYGIDFPHFSGSQYGMTQHISKDQAKMGDLVFWGNHGAEHVGVYAGGNKYFSAESPSQGIHMNTLDSVVGKGKPLFGRVRGLSQTSSKHDDIKAKNGLEKTIKGQVGNGFFKFLAKLGDLFGMTGEAGMPTGDHTHWMKQAHIPRSDWAGINYIVSAESGWNPNARNPSSGTYGLGQMQGYNLHYYTKHGGKSNAIAQLMGIMDYIHDRYGSVASAVRFRKANNWYGNGGIVRKPELAVVGEEGIERIINVNKPTADSLIDNTIQARAQVAPESPSGKLAKLIDLNAVRYSAANGYGTPQNAKSKTVINQVGNNQQFKTDGDVVINVNADGAKLARVIYPKWKILHGHEIDIASAGGAISE
ncbi:NlpC/P60 family protein [Lactobacillus crispatus]|uniref:aggregation-promoting factor C-terminal-like domain-containing protein n=1 Tax=Lactobacillus crispatus TaxID=47770 RepID=UPI000B5DB0E5|nr:NlpC/P60 family protein [Lactobacillus crispatus]OXC15457.1 hypothetical protein AYP78_04245 [Lactobacillus crispatus]OXC16728.1 hypothetical protein AYP79_08885 [Lactobacillus crispatus]OXC16962.1 hypothetical protein AYP80_03130 [Lactobacillus crispatus]OXC26318.1 hypothetical protein AYP84_01100 [Lactobacillus crispatus]